MKKNTMNTMALAAFVLLLSSTFAAAGAYSDVNQNDDGTGEGSSTFATTDIAAGDIVETDRKVPRGPGRQLVKPRFKPRPELVSVDPRFTGTICLNFPVHGRRICWSDLLDGL